MGYRNKKSIRFKEELSHSMRFAIGIRIRQFFIKLDRCGCLFSGMKETSSEEASPRCCCGHKDSLVDSDRMCQDCSKALLHFLKCNINKHEQNSKTLLKRFCKGSMDGLIFKLVEAFNAFKNLRIIKLESKLFSTVPCIMRFTDHRLSLRSKDHKKHLLVCRKLTQIQEKQDPDFIPVLETEDHSLQETQTHLHVKAREASIRYFTSDFFIQHSFENQSALQDDDCIDVRQIGRTFDVENQLDDNIKVNDDKDNDTIPELKKYLTPTELPIPPTEIIVAPAHVLDPIINQLANGSNPGPKDTMKFEMLRLNTLRNYPKENKPSLIRLAAAGFYYAADGDEVVCYCCGVRRHGWTADCVPMDVHRRLMPKCSFLTRNSEVNIPVPEAPPEVVDRFAFLQPLIDEEIVDEGYDVPIAAAPRSEIPRHVTDSTALNAGRNTVAGNSHTSFLTEAQHPHYGVQRVRLQSFQGWPRESHQDPQVLAEAGFFYAGMGDCVRCFQCGVGLKNWEKDDSPWIEHGRWTLHTPCPYLIMMKGEEFVDLIRMAVEMTGTDPTQTSALDVPPQTFTAQQASTGSANANTNASDENTPVAHVATKSGSQSISKRTEAREVAVDTDTASGRVSMTTVTHLKTSDSQPTSRRSRLNAGQMSGSSANHTTGSTMDDRRKQLAAENEMLRDQMMCKVCFEQQVCIIFLPCGHLVTCAECAPTLQTCPVCKKFVKGTVKTYVA